MHPHGDADHYNGVSKFHMRIDYGLDGTWTTTHDGVMIDSGMLNPNPKGSDWATLKQQYTDNGAVIYSSIWVGWVPYVCPFICLGEGGTGHHVAQMPQMGADGPWCPRVGFTVPAATDLVGVRLF